MGDRAEFPVSTLEQMASIPEERVDRFLAELPDMLRVMRQIKEALPALAAKSKAEAPWPLSMLPRSVFENALMRAMSLDGAMKWVDDDKGLATVNLRWGKEGAPFFSQTESMRDPR